MARRAASDGRSQIPGRLPGRRRRLTAEPRLPLLAPLALGSRPDARNCQSTVIISALHWRGIWQWQTVEGSGDRAGAGAGWGGHPLGLLLFMSLCSSLSSAALLQLPAATRPGMIAALPLLAPLQRTPASAGARAARARMRTVGRFLRDGKKNDRSSSRRGSAPPKAAAAHARLPPKQCTVCAAPPHAPVCPAICCRWPIGSPLPIE